MDYVQFIRDAATRTRQQAVNINPCADAGDKVKTALLDRAGEWNACADEMRRLQDRVRELENIERDRIMRAT